MKTKEKTGARGPRLPGWMTSRERRVGHGAFLAVVADGGRRRDASKVQVAGFSGPGPRGKSVELIGARAAAALRKQLDASFLGRLLAATAHATRLALLAELLGGPATYRQLVAATGRRAGPLYHHITKLRLVGLVEPLERDLYALTRTGREVLLGLMAVGKLAAKSRSARR